MARKVNVHVERLQRYLPFSPAFDQIYEEYQDSEHSLNLETKALKYLRNAAQRGARLIILTGDAGHGKTHLCRRLIQEHLGYDEDAARRILNEECQGVTLIAASGERPGTTPLRIYKDFSELTIPVAAARLEASALGADEVVVVCANEGRLRAVLESREAGPTCSRVQDHFRRSFQDGLASRDAEIHILNLNYQSVAAEDGPNLLRMALKDWLSGNRWRVCQPCDSRDACPILHNREMLISQSTSMVLQRQQTLEAVFATIERLGVVVTIRDMLMALAYLLTGGLRCDMVHNRVDRARQGWQHQYAFYNLLFERPGTVKPEQLARISVVPELSRLDPGARATRVVDERLINEQKLFPLDGLDTVFARRDGARANLVDAANGIDEVIGNPRNLKERRAESAFVTAVMRSLRRRVFFDDELERGSLMARLGFDHGDDFQEILAGELAAQRVTSLKNRMIAGLHALQGLRLGTRQTTLHLVDPAFGNATMDAAIIARRIPASRLSLIPMAAAWSVSPDSVDALSASVDWLDRRIVLRVTLDDDVQIDLPLDLVAFECVVRAGAGYVAEEFYAHDIRRVLSFLGRLAERNVDRDQEIELVIHGTTRSVSIDGGVVQVGGGS